MLRGVAGPDTGYTEIADRLAGAGFAALVHGWQVRGNDPPDADLFTDIRGALAFLKARPEVDAGRLAVFGYCKGGGQALLAAVECPELGVVVSFHGFALRQQLDAGHPRHPIDVADQLRRPVLILHGEADDVSLLPDMRKLAERLTASGCRVGFTSYPSAKHGFAVSTHPGFLASAAEDGFSRAVAFVRDHLG